MAGDADLDSPIVAIAFATRVLLGDRAADADLAARLPLARAIARAGVPLALCPVLADALSAVLPLPTDAAWSPLDDALDRCAAQHPSALAIDVTETLHVALRFDQLDLEHRRHRRSDGVFYTPAPLAAWLVASTLEGVPAGAVVADIACGAGAFLVAAADHGAGPTLRLLGVDIDPVAVEVTRARLFVRLQRRGLGEADAIARLAADVQVGDGLALALPPLDAVIGNPPFGNAISAETGRQGAEAGRHKLLFPAVAVGAYDLSFLFASRAIAALRPGGRYGLILPRSALSLASAAGLRRQLEDDAPPEMIWALDARRLFVGADVLVTVLRGTCGGDVQSVEVSTAAVGDHGGPAEPTDTVVLGKGRAWGATWAPLVLPAGDLIARLEVSAVARVPLQELAEIFGGASTEAAYQLRDCALDDARGVGLRLVTTGLIDRYQCAWGARPCRYLKRTWRHPRWPPLDGAVPVAVERAGARQLRPKVLVAGLTRVLEAVADPSGQLGGVVSTWAVYPPEDQPRALWLLEAVLNAPVLSVVYMTRFAGKALSGGNTTVGRHELRGLPVFADLLALAQPPTVLAEPPDSPFDLDACDPQGRWTVAAATIDALGGRAPGTAPEAATDAWIAAAVSWLYGLNVEDHAAALAWHRARLRGPPRRRIDPCGEST